MTRFHWGGALLLLTAASTFGCSRARGSAETREHSPAAAVEPATASYDLDVTSWEGPVGEEGYVLVTITAKGDHHINASYPQKVKLDAPAAGLTLPSRELRLDDAQLEGDKRLVYTVPLSADRVGDYQLRGQVHLSVCSEDQCRIDKAPLTARVVAQ